MSRAENLLEPKPDSLSQEAVVKVASRMGRRSFLKTTAAASVGLCIAGFVPELLSAAARGAAPVDVDAAAAAVAGAGPTERIAAADAGLTAAVLRSSRLLPAARSSAGPRDGAATAAGSLAAAADRASPPIEASASPPTDRYGDPPCAACDPTAGAVVLCVDAEADAGVVVDAVGELAALRDAGVRPVAGARVAAADEAAAVTGGAVLPAAGAIGCPAVAGIRRTTAGWPALAVVLAAVRAEDAAAAADGAGRNERRAAETASAGPVARGSRAGTAAPTGPAGSDDARSAADISGATAPSVRAAVSPGAACPTGTGVTESPAISTFSDGVAGCGDSAEEPGSGRAEDAGHRPHARAHVAP